MNVKLHHVSLIGAIAFAAALVGCGGSGSTVNPNAPGKFAVTKMVSDQPGVAAVTDPDLINPWGIAFSPTSPFWVSDNGTGLATLYNGAGAKQGLVVTIPTIGGGANGPVTGQVFNGTADFPLRGGGASHFLFSSEDGIISAWGAGGAATVGADRSASGAIYKGLAMAANGGANFLYATNFHANTVDVFDTTFTLVNSFTDPNVSAGFAPFGIANVGGLLYVTYAKQDATKEDDVSGAGNGFVDVFNPDGTLNRRLISHGPLNSPWGVALAPAGFGNVGGALLVGNFGDGRVNAFDPTTGHLMGSLKDDTGAPLQIDGLWALTPGNGGNGGTTDKIYFTAGPGGEAHGLLGSLSPVPVP
jgi:uncharacterized protein (TIGR03118 family)